MFEKMFHRVFDQSVIKSCIQINLLHLVSFRSKKRVHSDVNHRSPDLHHGVNALDVNENSVTLSDSFPTHKSHSATTLSSPSNHINHKTLKSIRTFAITKSTLHYNLPSLTTNHTYLRHHKT